MTTVTYFIQAVHGGPVKIGRSTGEAGPRSRLSICQVGCPDELRIVGVVRGNYERAFHGLWREQRIRGEWFQPVEEMCQHAPDLLLTDHRPPVDVALAVEQAFRDGWREAMRHASHAVAATLQEELEDLANLPTDLPDDFRNRIRFAPGSHDEATSEGGAA